MPRHPRTHALGLLYHVMARGNNGQNIFPQAKDYEVFLEQLREARRRYPFYLYAYVLMPNYFHLLLEVMELPTARIMQSLLTGYVRRFNRKHRRKGHLFQGRYKALCATETVIFWSLCVTFISIRYERGWSNGPQTGGGVGMGSISGQVRTDSSTQEP